MTPRLLLFDFDFTLFDASGCLFAALRKGLQAVRKQEPSDSELKPLIGLSLEKQFTLLTGDQRSELYDVFKIAYIKERDLREESGTHPLPGAIEAVKHLKKKGFKLGIVSTGAPGRILRSLARYDALSSFDKDAVIGGMGDKAQAIRNALGHFGEKASDSVYIGDRPDDRSSALEAGVDFIGVSTGAFRKEDFPNNTIVLSSVATLPSHFESSP